MKDLTVYELMGDDMIIIAKREKDGDITATIVDGDENVVYHEKSHKFAWESLVSFAEQIIRENRRLGEEE